jgi:hypothetical protein
MCALGENKEAYIDKLHIGPYAIEIGIHEA